MPIYTPYELLFYYYGDWQFTLILILMIEADI